jgi:hypothetical protein
MKPAMRAAVLGCCGVLSATVSTVVRADEPVRPRRVWVETRPWTCSRELPRFARNVELACDAVGGACEIAASAAEATERATLYCDGRDTWRVELAGALRGETLTVTLPGDREQRLRRAGMWVARLQAAPEPAPVAEPSPETPPPETETPAVVPDIAEPSAPPVDADAAKQITKTTRHARIESHLGVALSAFTGVTNGAPGVSGFRGEVAIPLSHGFYWGPNVAYAEFSAADWAGPWNWAGQDAGRGVLAGGIVGWGAPYDDFWVGVALGVGGGATWGTSAAVAFSSVPCPVAGCAPSEAGAVKEGGQGTAYGRVAVTLQLPIKSWPVRPTLSLTGTHLTNELGSSAQMAALELGLAWRAP